MYTYSGDGYFRKWDVEKGEVIDKLKIEGYITSLFIGENEEFLAVGHHRMAGFVEVYNIKTMVKHFEDYASNYMFNAYSGEIMENYTVVNNVIVNASQNELVSIVGAKVGVLNQRPDEVTIGAIVHFNLETGKLKNVEKIKGYRKINKFSRNKSSCVYHDWYEYRAWTHGGQVSWDVRRESNLWFIKYDPYKTVALSYKKGTNTYVEDFSRAFISNDDKYVFAYSRSDVIRVWNTVDENLVRKINVSEFPTDIDFPLGDEYIITVDTRHWKEGEEYKSKQLINFRDIDTYARIDSIEFPTNMKWFIAISPDSTSFATGSEDGKIRIFNPKLLSNDLNAIFAADSTTKFSRKPVHFLDYSSGEPDSWYWDFGDGSTSMEQNPSHTYMKTGKYTVKLVVGKDGEKDSLVKEEYIVVRERLNAAIQANKTLGEVPFTVEFKDMSTGEKQNWFWDFGDSTTSDQQNPIHTYNESGTYTVRLIVTDDYGADTLVKEDYIEVLEYMEADFSISDTVGRAPMSVTFSDLSTGNPDSYTWFFGDNYSSTERNPVHTYDNPGVYSVELMIENKLKTSKENKPNMVIVREGTAVSTFQSKSYNLKPLSIPFSDNISFELDLLRTSAVTLTIHDLYGNKLNTLANGNYNAGSHRFLFNGSDLAAGVYFYRLLIDGEMDTGKVMKRE